MLQLTNKYKLYFYLFLFIFLSSIFNFALLEKYEDKFTLKNINIYGLSVKEAKMVQDELSYFQNTNIFKLKKKELLKKLSKFNYLSQIYINKVMPSTININLTKTFIIAKTQKDSEIFYIGQNGKYINANQIIITDDPPIIFGDFKINEFIDLQKILKNQKIDLKNINKYFYYKNKRWDLKFSNGTLLMLPSKNIEKSIKIYNKLVKNNNFMNNRIIDLRVSNQIILSN